MRCEVPKISGTPSCKTHQSIVSIVAGGQIADNIPLDPWGSLFLLCPLRYGTWDWRSKPTGKLLEEVAVDSPGNDPKRGLDKQLCPGHPQGTVTRRGRDW